jgi:3'-5' exonuclease
MVFNLSKILFFDVETVCQYERLSELPETQRKLWLLHFERFEERAPSPKLLPEKYDGLGNITDEYKNALYRQTAALFPEFSKVCCVTLGYIMKDGKYKTESFYGEDEVHILKETRRVFNAVEPKGYSLCGHNIKVFDIPFLGKRYLINNLNIPTSFPKYDTKPWDLKYIDTKEIWNFGNKMGLSSLDLVTTCLDIPTPKDGDVKGDNVGINYYAGKHDEIKEYCEKDVVALMDIMVKLTNLEND